MATEPMAAKICCHNSMRAADVREAEHEVVAGEGRGRREGQRDGKTDERRARHDQDGLADAECGSACHESDGDRAQRACAGVVREPAGGDRDEQGQRENGHVEHECHEHADAEQAEDDAEHHDAILLVFDFAVICFPCPAAMA